MNELMIIHQCESCQQFSINRIAADDRPDLLEELYQETLDFSEAIISLLFLEGIHPLTKNNKIDTLACLFGKAYL